jgi:FixJ family two-component response regulator
MGERPVIAIVDDEESVRRALARVLSVSSFTARAFGSGHEFLESLATQRPDCVVLDYQMPGLTGRDVQRRLALARISIPIIVVTAHVQPALREQCLADGAVAYLAKPLQRELLVALINDVLRQRAAGSAV